MRQFAIRSISANHWRLFFDAVKPRRSRCKDSEATRFNRDHSWAPSPPGNDGFIRDGFVCIASEGTRRFTTSGRVRNIQARPPVVIAVFRQELEPEITMFYIVPWAASIVMGTVLKPGHSVRAGVQLSFRTDLNSGGQGRSKFHVEVTRTSPNLV